MEVKGHLLLLLLQVYVADKVHFPVLHSLAYTTVTGQPAGKKPFLNNLITKSVASKFTLALSILGGNFKTQLQAVINNFFF